MKKYEANPKLKETCEILDEGFADAIQVLNLRENIQRRVRTTNCLEINRGECVIRIFLNRESAIRLIGSLFIDKNDEWISSSKKYLNFYLAQI